ncbi:ExbD/TolR family protein [Hydrogenophilus thiooxidans]|uniref:ExbD/TolR family protein n=1 Tax=Hydrogenophilus thiooxidans TaxID=2820326 RepID=UPI001C22C41D|nr:biopolymer transporter ExbD [Hydrogenophilus thiooxidans]
MMRRPLPFLAVKSRASASPTINVVPLVDVLLVLLVILLVTAPALLHAVRTELPRASHSPAPANRDAITLTLTANGALLWNGTPVTEAALRSRLAELTATPNRPPLLLAVERTVPFEQAAQVMVTLTEAGIREAQFLLDPNGR